MKKLEFMRRSSAFALVSALYFQGGVAFADDTEIFFGSQAVGDAARPNVLFILDDSGSMAWCVNRNSDSCGESKSRMRVLKDTMTNLLNTTSGVNIGLMVLNNSAQTSGDAALPRLLQPVANIEAPVNFKLASPEIKVSTDDASRYNGSTNVTDPTLLMGYVNSPSATNVVMRSLGAPNIYSNDNSTYYLRSDGTFTYSCSVKMPATGQCLDGPSNTINANSSASGRNGLLLFRNINIPSAAVINSAILELKPTGGNASTSFDIYLVNSKTPGAFNDSSPIDLSMFTAKSTVTSAKLGTGVHQLNITSQIQALQNVAPTANPLGDIAVALRSKTATDFKYLVGDDPAAPVLTINYTYVPNPSTARTTGLRFQTVSIPQGAQVTNASLSFVPASSDDRNVSFSVQAENTGNAASFSTGEDFTGRAKTSAKNWTPAAWRTENPPVYADDVADVTSQVQEVVNNSSWCGNNAMAFFLTPNGGDGARTAFSQDGNDGLKPMLSVSYTGGDTGCMKPIVELNLIDEKDDGRQYRYSGSYPKEVSLTDSSLYFTDTNTYLGLRYQKVPFKKNAGVESVTVVVTPSSLAGTSATADVYFEKKADSAGFVASSGNIGDRTPTTAKASCTFTSKGPGIPVTCESAQLKTALSEVLGLSGWADGNSLSLIMKQTSGSSSLGLTAFELNKANSVSLQVKLSSTAGLSESSYKTRDYLKNVVSNMKANSGTPLVDRIYQAAQYYTDLPGKHKGPTSPIQSSCQANYLVVMTDGQANGNSSATISGAKALTGGGCVSRDSGEQRDGETCGVELAKWLRNTDQSNNLDEDNTVTTHTVGFALQASAGAKKFLADVAAAGGGKAYTADDANQLANAFNSIIQEALATDTTFVSATAPVNSFNRQDHKDQLYFSLFRPGNTDRWPGNLKRYKMDTSSGSPVIVDGDGASAVDPNTGFFKKNARSFWSSTADGPNVVQGGAASKLPNPSSRVLFTNKADGTLTALNNSLTPSLLGVSTTADRDALVNYIRGYEPGSTSVLRMALGDPIHATPSLISYSCASVASDGSCLGEQQSAIIGTNEGFVQVFDTNTGVEQSAFMPAELLGNIKRLNANANTGNLSHLYGMDNTVTVWSNDINNNNVIDGSDFVYAYASMGRGGRSIYALNVTNPTSPQLLWTIQGGSGSYSRLGQTWSAPVKTKIKVGSTITDVLVFAGGYDPNQDSVSSRTTDTQGNDLFIVNAKTGALLWSASAAGVNMQYSAPGKVRVTSLEKDAAGRPVLNKDQLATQLFVGDMGGQIWRFVINNGSTGNALASGKVFASVAGSGAANARRFYQEPELALLNVNNVPNLTVSIGSGYRGHPLDKIIEDRFYTFRTTDLTGTGSTVLSESDLYNATSLETITQAQQDALLNKQGWYINLTRNGEKVLSNAMAIGGDLYFNTYQPVVAQNSCRPTQGVSRGYRVRLLDSSAVGDTRFSVLKGVALPSNPQVFCKGDSCWAYNDPSQLIPTTGGSGGAGRPDDPEEYPMGNVSRMYWTDKQD